MQRSVGDRAEVGRESEQRPRHGLRRTVAGQEVGIAHDAAGHHRGLQQRQHNVSTAEDQCTGAVHPFQQGYRGRVRGCRPQGQPDERCGKQQQRHDAQLARDGVAVGVAAAGLRDLQCPPAQQPCHRDGGKLSRGRGQDHGQQRRQNGQRGARPVRAQRLGHPQTACATMATATTEPVHPAGLGQPLVLGVPRRTGSAQSPMAR